MRWASLAAQVFLALQRPPSPKRIAARAELWVVAAVCFVTAAGFITLGLYLWVWSLVGAIGAAFILATGYVMVGLLALVIAGALRRRLPPPASHPAANMGAVALAFLEGLSRGSNRTADVPPGPDVGPGTASTPRPRG